jgi:hypothetical protein
MRFTCRFTVLFTSAVNGSYWAQGSCASHDDGFWKWAKHKIGLERPHFVATETVAVAPAQGNRENTLFLMCFARVL